MRRGEKLLKCENTENNIKWYILLICTFNNVESRLFNSVFFQGWPQKKVVAEMVFKRASERAPCGARPLFPEKGQPGQVPVSKMNKKG